MRTALTTLAAALLVATGYVAGTVGFGAALVLACLALFTGLMLAIIHSLITDTPKEGK